MASEASGNHVIRQHPRDTEAYAEGSDAGTDFSAIDGMRRNFVIVVDDKLFEKRLFNKSSRAQELSTKLAKKTGSSVVIALSEANREWGSKLQPAVHSNQVYRLHPTQLEEDTYIAVGVFHTTILEEKRQELQAILRELGAKRIEWSRRREWNVEYELPSSIVPHHDPSKLLFLPTEPNWQAMIEDRMMGWCSQYTLAFSYENDFQVNDEILTKINKKLGPPRISSKGNVLEQVAPSQVRAAFFKPIRDSVHITFFSRDEHKAYTQTQLLTKWTPLHVEAWLIMNRMGDWFPDFDERTPITAQRLFALDVEMLQEMYGLSDEQCATFFAHRSNIGDSTNLEVLTNVDDSAEVLRQEQLVPKKLKKKKSMRFPKSLSPNRNGEPNTGSTDFETKSDDPLGLGDDIMGSFEVVVLGDSGVGKSSIVNRWMGKSFNPAESATPGVIYLEHEMGKVTLNIWDTAGQPSHRSQAGLHARRADVCVFVYDITNPESFTVARELLGEVCRMGTVPHVAMCLVGNKCDNDARRKVSMVQGLKLAREFEIGLFFETSAVTDFNLNALLCNAILMASNREKPEDRQSVCLANPPTPPVKKKCCS